MPIDSKQSNEQVRANVNKREVTMATSHWSPPKIKDSKTDVSAWRKEDPMGGGSHGG